MSEKDLDRILGRWLARLGAAESAPRGRARGRDREETDIAELLAAHVDGTLFPEERAELEHRLRSEPGLLEALRALEDDPEPGATEYRDSPDGDAPLVREAATSPADLRGTAPVRGLDRWLGLVAVAAAAGILLVVAASRIGQPPGRAFPVPSPGRVLAVRGDVRIVEGPYDVRRMRRWDRLVGGETLRLGADGDVRLLRSSGLHRLTAEGWSLEIGGIPDTAREFAARGDSAPAPGPTRSSAGAGRVRPISPIARTSSPRPTFRWSGGRDGARASGAPPSYRITLEGSDGLLFNETATGSIHEFPEDADDLVRGEVYSWALFRTASEGSPPSSASALFEAIFVVASEGEAGELSREVEAIETKVADPECRRLLLAFLHWDRRHLGRAAELLSDLGRTDPEDPTYRSLLRQVLEGKRGPTGSEAEGGAAADAPR
jgi:hypothetical protein